VPIQIKIPQSDLPALAEAIISVSKCLRSQGMKIYLKKKSIFLRHTPQAGALTKKNLGV
jgi:hypothetical protein